MRISTQPEGCAASTCADTTTSSSACSLQACGLNLGLLMRQLMGVGTPRGLQGRACAIVDALRLALRRVWSLVSRSAVLLSENWTAPSWIRPMTPTHSHILSGLHEGSSATGC